MIALFVASFFLGLTGSLHCLGMCGPLILAVNSGNNGRFRGLSVYHSGRIMTYGMLGVLFGFMGMGIQLAGIQQFISIASGVFLLTLLVLGLFKSNLSKFVITDRFLTWLKQQFSPYLKSKKLIDRFMVGILNGLLPCGLVYVALAAALTSTNAVTGSLAMISFGLGTLPILAITTSFGHVIGRKFRGALRIASPFVIALVGCLLILRGLDLGIPFISPDLSSTGSHLH